MWLNHREWIIGNQPDSVQPNEILLNTVEYAIGGLFVAEKVYNDNLDWIMK